MTDEEAKAILRIAASHANSFKRAINEYSTDQEKHLHEQCAMAASNTAWFILSGLAYTPEEIKKLYEDVLREGGIT